MAAEKVLSNLLKLVTNKEGKHCTIPHDQQHLWRSSIVSMLRAERGVWGCPGEIMHEMARRKTERRNTLVSTAVF